ncbi:MAG: N-acetylmuramoyl-L-alanine amidase [Clostridia bacterium]|nr:N-acetylmuramoyl-L-alanine amidase [Clostridia bacterium]
MPRIYLSPSTQEFNPYVNGGNEEYYMNLIADAMVPYLNATGISYTRNTPDMTAASSIVASNSGNYGLHLALHSNAAGGSSSGQVRGSEVYFYPSSANGRRAAEIIANNLKMIYPLPDRVRAIPTTSLGEVSRTRAPSVLIEFAYHDNEEDANWIKNNIDAIARNVVLSLADYFGIPFMSPNGMQYGMVSTNGRNLNIRSSPTVNSAVIGSIPNGSVVTVYSSNNGWSSVDYNGVNGFVSNRYLTIY